MTVDGRCRWRHMVEVVIDGDRWRCRWRNVDEGCRLGVEMAVDEGIAVDSGVDGG